MKRRIKLFRNLFLIGLIVYGLTYVQPYRLRASDMASYIGQSLFMNKPTISEIMSVGNYQFFLLTQEDVMACVVVKRNYGILWNQAEFGTQWQDRTDLDSEQEFSQNCVDTYHDYFNTEMKRLERLGDTLRLRRFDMTTDLGVYVVSNDELGFETINMMLEPYLGMNYQSFLEEDLLPIQHYRYSDDQEGFSTMAVDSLTTFNIVNWIPDGDDRSYVLNFDFEYAYLHPERLSVQDVLEDPMHDVLFSDVQNEFTSMTDVATVKKLDAAAIERKIQSIIDDHRYDIRITDIHINSDYIYPQTTPEPTYPLENYIDTFDLADSIVDNKLTLSELRSESLYEILEGYGKDQVLIRTSDNALVHLSKTDKVALTEPVEVEGNRIQISIRPYEVEDLSKILEQPYAQRNIAAIIESAYTPIRSQETMREVATRIKTAIAEYYAIQASSLSITLRVDTIPNDQASQ